jgi:hypothetical protein
MKIISLLSLPLARAVEIEVSNINGADLMANQFCFSSYMNMNDHSFFFYESLFKPMIDEYI